MAKIKIFLFGASAGGQIAASKLTKRVQLLGYIDNSEAKIGSQLNGKNVYSPSILYEIEYDFVLISSMYVSEIQNQLLQMGIPREKILVSSFYSLKEPPFPWDAIIFLAMILIIGIGFMVFLAQYLLF